MAFPKHRVAAHTLITGSVDRVLLIESPLRGWEVPGGQIEEGEDIIAGLKREVFEESGVQIDVGKMVGVYSNLTLGAVIITFLSRYQSGTLTTSPESLKVEWYQRDACLKAITHPAILERIKDMLSFNGELKYRAYTIDPYRVVEERSV